MVQTSDPDPSMYGALPPGAWWEVANGGRPNMQPHGSEASPAAVNAAQQGDLEMRGVVFSYPVRWGGWRGAAVAVVRLAGAAAVAVVRLAGAAAVAVVRRAAQERAAVLGLPKGPVPAARQLRRAITQPGSCR